MRKLSIGLRLTLWYLAIFALAQLIFGAGMWFLLRYHLYDLADDALEAQVDDLKNFMEAQSKGVSVTTLQEEVAESYALEHSGDYLELYVDDGTLLYRSPFLQKHFVNLGAGMPDHPVYRDVWIDGQPFRFILQKLEANGRVYVVTTGVLNDDVVETLDQFRKYLLMFAPCFYSQRRAADIGSAAVLSLPSMPWCERRATSEATT